MVAGDIPWRRPADDAGVTPDSGTGYETPYIGPPVASADAQQWEITVNETTAPPRPLPAVDHDALDQAEDGALKLTYAVGFAAVGVLLMILIIRLV